MYQNLISEMARNLITKRDMAKKLGIHENTLKNKLAGKTRFDVDEGFAIRREYFPHLSLDYLFATDDQQEAEQPKEPEMPIGVRRAIEYHANKRQD